MTGNNDNNNINKISDTLNEKIHNAFKGVLDHKGFSVNLLKLLKLNKIGYGFIEFEVTVAKEHTNTLDGLHGGASATLMDGIGAFSYLCTQENQKELTFGVTVNMNINYITGATIGDKIIIKAQVEKLTKTLCFTKVTIEKADDSSLISTAQIIYKVPPKFYSKL
ncbi:thioesterase superfamily protein [Dictyostelium discoideum AX4]|uniref:Thioesterase superfamily protein n=1 Tax=Dictyostelium discoideum TaxID=44689 RepID=Q86HX3_DICDI|nr:thioesterase superfamily protein [Dictyostelium discoideum AX4]EAL69163.1 thioesterase superfamily protein [Dictyostelium discoideum AX4]|eukprot:XP_643112.1 thioesterase superfamily protein [Dictyostelium discoideum AX4]